MEIEKEVKSLMSRQDQLKQIQEQVADFFELFLVMSKELQYSNAKFRYNLKEHPDTIIDKLKFDSCSRAEAIVLFAYLEALRCMWTAYVNQTSDEQKLRNASNEAIDLFIKDFCLCKQNKWVKKYPQRAGKISVRHLRELRNALTHFFSVGRLGIAPARSEEEVIKISNMTNHRVQFITTNDLLGLIEGATILLLSKWSEDYEKSLVMKDSDFKKRLNV